MREKIDKMLASVDWQEFEIGMLFDVVRGRNFPKSDWLKGSVPIVTTTGLNNGVTDYIENINDRVSHNSITVAGTGTVGSSFYHPYFFNIGEWVLSLRLKSRELNRHIAQFLTTSISHQKDKYSYAYKMGNARLKRQKILLPTTTNGEPDWQFMEEYMKLVETHIQPKIEIGNHVITDNRELDEVDWQEFEIGELFKVINSRAYHKKNLSHNKDSTLIYISRTASNNGLDIMVDNDEEFTKNPPNTITFGAETVIFFYQPYEYITGNKMYYLQHTNINKQVGLFLTTILNRQFADSGFGFGRGLTGTRAKKQKILLPTTPQGEPDWHFMEQFMKRMENEITEQVN